MAIRPTSSASISYTATAGTNKYWKSVTGKTYAAGKWYPLGLRMWPEDALPGRFRVNGVQVYFSKGNLQCTRTKNDWSTYTWSFMEPQYTTVEQKGQYVGQLYADQNTVSLFGWATSGYNGRKPNQTADNYLETNYYTGGNINGTNYDWGVYNTISNGGTGWRTLTIDEWASLIGNHTNKASYVNGVFGWVIRPYGVTTAIANSYTAAAWAAEEANGTLFLPGSTYRYGQYVYVIDPEGYYWSSTRSSSSIYAHMLRFGSKSSVITTTSNADGGFKVEWGANVRLVKNVQ